MYGVFTGSVIERQGTFHIFYTGHNSHFEGTARPVQGVMHATSPDLCRWTKDERFLLFAPTTDYEKDDWRDPFVFWNEGAREYWMLLAARKRSGPSRQRGCTALATSPDLRIWSVREPFWAPDEYYTHECPDLFRVGEWWYLVYSTFSERCVTHYRMSRSLRGPWLAPPNDTFDGRAYYAAKTAGDGECRFAFGWLPTREEERDEGNWQWGGNLVVHQIEQQSDGTLSVRAPKTVLAPFSWFRPLSPKPVLGTWAIGERVFSVDSVGRCADLLLGMMPDECLVEANAVYKPGTASFGLLLRADEALDRYYQVRLEPANQRMVIDRWPRPGDQPFMLERPLAMRPGRAVRLQALVDGTCLVVYANEQVTLSCRLYNQRAGHLGLFVHEGDVCFQEVAIRCRE